MEILKFIINNWKKILYTSANGKSFKIYSIAGDYFSKKNSFRNISLLNILKNSLYLLNANKWNKLHNKIIQKSSKNLIGKILGLSMNNIDLSQKKNIAASAQKLTENVVLNVIENFWVTQKKKFMPCRRCVC